MSAFYLGDITCRNGTIRGVHFCRPEDGEAVWRFIVNRKSTSSFRTFTFNRSTVERTKVYLERSGYTYGSFKSTNGSFKSTKEISGATVVDWMIIVPSDHELHEIAMRHNVFLSERKGWGYLSMSHLDCFLKAHGYRRAR